MTARYTSVFPLPVIPCIRYLPFIPLLISAFRRAEDLALALDARCYNKEKWRTKLHPLKYSRADVAAYILLLLYLGTVIASKYAFEYMGFV